MHRVTKAVGWSLLPTFGPLIIQHDAVAQDAIGQSMILEFDEDLPRGSAFAREIKSGDFNGDGLNDAVISASSYNVEDFDNDTEIGSGAVYFLWGGDFGPQLPTPQQVIPEGIVQNQNFGLEIEPGDFNADGYDDLAVAAIDIAYTSPTNQDSIFLIYGNPEQDLSVSKDNQLIPTDFNSYGSILSTGDLNGDTFDDLIAVAYEPETSESYAATKVAIHYSNKGTVSTQYSELIGSPQPYMGTPDLFGDDVYGGSDYNADGYDDLIVGARLGETSFGLRGRVYGYYGSPDGVIDHPQELTPYDEQCSNTGNNITGADLNGDGYADAIIAAKNSHHAASYAGTLYVYYGSSTGLSTAWERVYSDETGSHDTLGHSLANAGDVDNDGFDDIIAGSGADVDYFGQGAAFIFFGSASGISTREERLTATNRVTTGFSNSVAGVGDIDGDGWDDVMIGETSHNDRVGRAFLFQANVTDEDGDGFAARYDCDDADSHQDVLRQVYPDADGDGYGAAGAGGALACVAPEGFVLNGLDCNDADADVSPAAREVCGDQIDNNCDGDGGYNGDLDRDGLGADVEIELGTDPCRSDTDDDGLSDGEEVNTYFTDPLNPDTDGDGVPDGKEVERGRDPLVNPNEEPDTADTADTASSAQQKTRTGDKGCGKGAAVIGLLGGMWGWRRKRS